jgi:hypothetical protein
MEWLLDRGPSWEALTPAQHEAAYLFYVTELGVSEIARRVAEETAQPITPQAIQKRLKRAEAIGERLYAATKLPRLRPKRGRPDARVKRS